MSSLMWKSACVSGAFSVLMGAFGAHALKASVPERMLKTWETAVQYHLAHSVVLLAASRSAAPTAGRLFLAGIVLFSGSLYGIVLTGITKLGIVTPIGGLAFVGGWLALAADGLK